MLNLKGVRRNGEVPPLHLTMLLSEIRRLFALDIGRVHHSEKELLFCNEVYFVTAAV
jgi:hypothetical protein